MNSNAQILEPDPFTTPWQHFFAKNQRSDTHHKGVHDLAVYLALRERSSFLTGKIVDYSKYSIIVRIACTVDAKPTPYRSVQQLSRVVHRHVVAWLGIHLPIPRLGRLHSYTHYALRKI